MRRAVVEEHPSRATRDAGRAGTEDPGNERAPARHRADEGSQLGAEQRGAPLGRQRHRRSQAFLVAFFGPLAVPALEALDAATRVDQLLLAGEERMALVAQFDVQLAAACGVGREGVAAGADDGGVVVLRDGCRSSWR